MQSQLWQPGERELEKSFISLFIKHLQNPHITDFKSLYEWSIQEPEKFWQACWNQLGIQGSLGSEPVPRIFEPRALFRASRWFPDARLNFAKNLLAGPPSGQESERAAIIFYGEDTVSRCISWKQLHSDVRKVRGYFRALGIGSNSVVAAITANTPETVVCMLAATSLGAAWCSVAPEFGPTGIVERFSQVEPSLLISSDIYFYKGKKIELEEKTCEVIRGLPSVNNQVLLPYRGESCEQDTRAAVSYFDILKGEEDETPFEEFPFHHPVYYLFTSGTTGKPKGIIHGAGGTLLEHKKELMLHTDLSAEGNIFYQTTCAWMMWNWLVSGLSTGATITLYDGFPLLRGGRKILEIVEEAKVTVFGTNPGYLRELALSNVIPKNEYNLSLLDAVLSTGSPLLESQFDWFYSNFPERVRLSSISGGTDIVGCFALGCPILPVFRGELQSRSLGYQVEAWDEAGQAVQDTKGELVCVRPFMSMPVGFALDSDGSRYGKTYFSTFGDVWHHGDVITVTSHGGVVVHERSDDVLNAGGVRIGPAEIYRQVLKFPEIQEAVAVTVPVEEDERIGLFVILKSGAVMTEELQSQICHALKHEESPRHVPWKIFVVSDFPRTMSGKVSASAIKAALSIGKTPNKDALKNPEILKEFQSHFAQEKP